MPRLRNDRSPAYHVFALSLVAESAYEQRPLRFFHLTGFSTLQLCSPAGSLFFPSVLQFFELHNHGLTYPLYVICH
jgi:hypothetical protein